MAHAPHRPVRKPAAGGAARFRTYTKNVGGRFCKADDPDAVVTLAAKKAPVKAALAETAAASAASLETAPVKTASVEASPINAPAVEAAKPPRSAARTPHAEPPATRQRRSRASTPAQLVARLIRTIERELNQIEEILNGARVSPARRSEAEKCTRSLASLTRTLADMTKLNDAAKEAKAHHDDEALPRDLDEFRRTLERRLADMADGGSRAADRGDEPGGDGMA